jgi:RNA polymerase sigma-70 factor (ECF subfamily)
MDDDERLLEAIRRGDAESFGVLYDRTRDFLRDAVIAPRVGRDAAEDVLSETFRTALDKLRSFEWRGIGVVHWLASIARRKALERVRGAARERERAAPLEPLLDVPDGAASVEAEMIGKEALAAMNARVESTLGALPARYAEALRLRLMEGRERAACAEALAVSTATFDVVLHRAAKAFAREWERR